MFLFWTLADVGIMGVPMTLHYTMKSTAYVKKHIYISVKRNAQFCRLPAYASFCRIFHIRILKIIKLVLNETTLSHHIILSWLGSGICKMVSSQQPENQCHYTV